MLKVVTPCSAELFAGAVIMPNLVPPVTTLAMAGDYRAQILDAAGTRTFTPLMTLFFTDFAPGELEKASGEIFAVKLYPEGVTTNSASGITDLRRHERVFKTMEEIGIPLLVHGETHGFVMDREREFISTYKWLASTFPRLRIVMEHISTSDTVDLLAEYENLYATVTLHHLLLTLDDMAGGLLNPHLFCKPILKSPRDRDALQAAVLAGNPKIMFGSDSAPHPRHTKECFGCAAGTFTSPVAMPMLAEFFDRHNSRSQMQTFISDNAIRCHRLTLPPKFVSLKREPLSVATRIGEVVPFMAGEVLPWSASVAT